MRTELIVVGALNRDWLFEVDHVPEPGETILGRRHFADGGKGANQAVQAAQLGVATALVGKVGDDATGVQLVEALVEAGVDVRYVGQQQGAASGIGCIWAASGGEKRIVVAPGGNDSLDPVEVEAAGSAIKTAVVLLVQLEVPYDAVCRAVALGSAGSASVILNAAPARSAAIDLLPQVDVLIVNRQECATLSRGPVGTSEDVDAAAQELVRLGASTVIVTLGSQGAIVVSATGRTRIMPVPVETVDGTGAGDAFCGAVAAGLARGLGIIDSARVGAVAGALCATRPGARSRIGDAERILRQLNHYARDHKV